ncbi:hypothetical protein N7520_005042 [Penicillium odoratum]|uniref:uncharacterized protein n=1 Tax=Penicillium odoratum TaxID=1167516 RepID=UPI002546EB9B|nr:uncharacterized protein N7520_005042 [Penicillium odoratum]KAJ5765483.1 hypothetical protein N7520_005042 [Penicillium odoratum]
MENGVQYSDINSETFSLSSSIYRGVMENGRRYQTMREGEYWGPADDQHFEALEAGYLSQLVMDSESPNALFQSPIQNPQNVLDIGTGRGTWAIDIADMFPSAMVRGVDLFPPPIDWMPPNCVLEVDDVLQDWTWRDPFDFIHMSIMIGAFSKQEWKSVYQQCYDNLIPGGWIEQFEGSCNIMSDDGSLPEDSILANWGDNLIAAANKSGHPMGTLDTMREQIENAGFVDVHEKVYKWPIGGWAKDPVLKEAGRLNSTMWKSGMEGWAMYLLTRYGSPKPWAKQEVQVLIAKARSELKDPAHHVYIPARRIWARKPTNEEVAERSKGTPESTRTVQRVERAPVPISESPTSSRSKSSSLERPAAVNLSYLQSSPDLEDSSTTDATSPRACSPRDWNNI